MRVEGDAQNVCASKNSVRFWDFVNDGWSMFDLIVVTVSYVSMFSDSPGFSHLRLMRAFRVSDHSISRQCSRRVCRVQQDFQKQADATR